jgi:hypothetical protein
MRFEEAPTRLARVVNKIGNFTTRASRVGSKDASCALGSRQSQSRLGLTIGDPRGLLTLTAARIKMSVPLCTL